MKFIVDPTDPGRLGCADRKCDRFVRREGILRAQEITFFEHIGKAAGLIGDLFGFILPDRKAEARISGGNGSETTGCVVGGSFVHKKVRFIGGAIFPGNQDGREGIAFFGNGHFLAHLNKSGIVRCWCPCLYGSVNNWREVDGHLGAGGTADLIAAGAQQEQDGKQEESEAAHQGNITSSPSGSTLDSR